MTHGLTWAEATAWVAAAGGMPRPDDGEEKVLSPSQWDQYADCPRKWAWKYLHGLEEPEKDSQKVGKRVHTLLEDYCGIGAPLPILEVMQLDRNYLPGQIAQAAIPFLPPPGWAKVEEGFRLVYGSGAWRGFKDLRGAVLAIPGTSAVWVPRERLGEEHVFPVVWDHKTTTNLKWAKTEDQLRANIQAHIYARSEMEETGARKVLAQWTYLQTTKIKAQPTQLWIGWDENAEYLERVAEPKAREIRELYQIRPKAKELPANPEMCDRYGGCAYRPVCNLGLKERMEASMAKETIADLVARKKRERDALENGGAPPLVAPQAAPVVPPVANLPPLPPIDTAGVQVPQVPPAPVAPPVAAPQAPTGYWKPGDPENPAQAYLRGQGKPLSVIASAADVPPPDHIRLAYDHGGKTEAGVINPPEAPPVAPPSPAHMPPVAPAAPATPPPPAAPQDALDGMSRDDLKALAIAYGILDSSARHGADAIRTMLRAKGVHGPLPQTTPATPPPAPLVPPAPPAPLPRAPEVPQAPPQLPITPDRKLGGFVLFLNCKPQKEMGPEYVLSKDLISAATDKLREDGIPDYRLVDYGKGPAMLCAIVEDYLAELAPEAVILDAHTPEGLTLQQTLERLSSAVIRGF